MNTITKIIIAGVGIAIVAVVGVVISLGGNQPGLLQSTSIGAIVGNGCMPNYESIIDDGSTHVIFTDVNGVFRGETMGGFKGSFEEAKKSGFKKVDGRVAHQVTIDQLMQARAGYDVEIINGAVKVTRGDAAIKILQGSLKNYNRGIYKQIADVLSVKDGKELLGGNTAKEVAKISELQNALKTMCE